MSASNNKIMIQYNLYGLVAFILIALVLPSEKMLSNYVFLNKVADIFSHIPTIALYISTTAKIHTTTILLLLSTIYFILFSYSIIFKLEIPERIDTTKINKLKTFIAYLSMIGLFLFAILTLIYPSSFETNDYSPKKVQSIVNIFLYMRTFTVGEATLLWGMTISLSLALSAPLKILFNNVFKK